MKKIISILLAIIMAFSVSITAFAATEAISVDKKITVTLKQDEEKTYSFKAPSQGIYKLTAKILNNSAAYVEIEHDEYSVETCLLFKPSEDLDLADKHEMKFCAEKGSSFKINLENCYDGESDFEKNAKVEITISKYNATAAKTGNNTVSKNGSTFLFVPDKDGKYNFRSSADKTFDPYIEIHNIDGFMDSNDDNGYENDMNFDLTVSLKKGKVYAVVCENYSADFESEPTKGYSLTISYNKKVDVEKIGFEWYENGEKIILCKGDWDIYLLSVVPTGAFPYADVSVSVSNPKVISAELEEDNTSVYVSADRIGKSTITVTDAKGASSEYTIVVLPWIFGFIRNIFDSFLIWLF